MIVVIVFLIGILVIMILCIYNKGIKPAINDYKINSLFKYASLPANNEMFLRRRGQKLAKAIKIVDDKHDIIRYKPEEHIYTGATVGGITMGSVNKVGGYNYVSGTKQTGKYQIYYAGELIKSITLDSDLYNIAKNSKIAKYIDGHKIIIVESVISPATRLLAGSGQKDMAKQMMSIDSSHGYGFPSYEKCIEIVNWICGID